VSDPGSEPKCEDWRISRFARGKSPAWILRGGASAEWLLQENEGLRCAWILVWYLFIFNFKIIYLNVRMLRFCSNREQYLPFSRLREKVPAGG
jgi:hypothetical protein